jgi:hypothetical protein
MLQENVKSDKYQDSIEQAINYVKNLNFDDIKARFEGYENPAALKMQNSELEFTPDITASKYGSKYYFEIAERTDDTKEVISKWQLLSTLAKMKGGEFKVFVPYGSMKFTNDILKSKDITAEVVKLK